MGNYFTTNHLEKNKGNHILNFKTPFSSPYFYGFTGTVMTTSSNVVTLNTIERLVSDIQDTKNLQIRTLISDGTLRPYDFYRTNILCFG